MFNIIDNACQFDLDQSTRAILSVVSITTFRAAASELRNIKKVIYLNTDEDVIKPALAEHFSTGGVSVLKHPNPTTTLTSNNVYNIYYTLHIEA